MPLRKDKSVKGKDSSRVQNHLCTKDLNILVFVVNDTTCIYVNFSIYFIQPEDNDTASSYFLIITIEVCQTYRNLKFRALTFEASMTGGPRHKQWFSVVPW